MEILSVIQKFKSGQALHNERKSFQESVIINRIIHDLLLHCRQVIELKYFSQLVLTLFIDFYALTHVNTHRLASDAGSINIVPNEMVS